MLLWHLINDHPYVDGNKRFAVAAFETFLWLNQATLLATDDELEALAIRIARGEVDREECRRFVVARCARLRWGRSQILGWVLRVPPDDRSAVREYLAEHRPLERSLRISAVIREALEGPPRF